MWWNEIKSFAFLLHRPYNCENLALLFLKKHIATEIVYICTLLYLFLQNLKNLCHFKKQNSNAKQIVDTKQSRLYKQLIDI